METPKPVYISRKEKSEKIIGRGKQGTTENCHRRYRAHNPCNRQKILHRKLISTQRKLQRSPRIDVPLIKHTLKGPGGKDVSASEKARKVEDRAISASKLNVWKVESNEEDSCFECYNKSHGKPLHVDIDKKVTEGGPALSLQSKNS